MTTPNELEDAIERAKTAFMEPSAEDERETGFESTELPAHEVQMRKACRALALGLELLPHEPPAGELSHQRYFTAAIELSFNVTERSCQAALLESEQIGPEDHRSHTEILEMSHRAGLWDVETANSLSDLYRENRSKFYYRKGIPSRTRAQTVIGVARQIHDLLAERNEDLQRACLCD